MTDRIIKMNSIPDLSMTKYDRYGRSCQNKAQGVLATVLGQLWPENAEWLGLGFQYEPEGESPQERLKLFVNVHTENPLDNDKNPFPGSHAVAEFFAWEESSADQAFGAMAAVDCPIFTVQQEEEFFFNEGKDRLYYAPVPWKADSPTTFAEESDSLLDSLRSPCRVYITFKPTSLTDEERYATIQELEELERLASGFDPERKDSGSLTELSRRKDPIAKRHMKLFQRSFDGLFKGPVYEAAIWILAANEREAHLVASSIGLCLAADGRFEVQEFRPGAEEYPAIKKAVASFAHYAPPIICSLVKPAIRGDSPPAIRTSVSCCPGVFHKWPHYPGWAACSRKPSPRERSVSPPPPGSIKKPSASKAKAGSWQGSMLGKARPS